MHQSKNKSGSACVSAPESCSVEDFRALLGVDCNMALVVVNVMAVSSFAIFILVLFIIVKKR